MLNVFYRDSHLQGRMSGPLKVIGNLFKSLDDCGIEYAINEEVHKHNFFLHWDPYHVEVYKTIKNKESLLVGPQMWPFDPEFKEHCYNMICDKVILKYSKAELGIDDVLITDEVMSE